ncbi:oxidoreductase family protein [Frankia sp. R43]|uniref:oxidoreductase family protein n=1 Tax=Frankia sp. R43 TaxID=269536 RepID=UPI0006CA2C98|nr:oxidoreductase family protein [Frankia sp. R43]
MSESEGATLAAGTGPLPGTGDGAGAGDVAWIVDDPHHVTPQWMTAVLRHGGTDTEITGLRHEPVGSGQLSSSYRFHLTGAPDAAETAPPSVVLKLAAGTPAGRAQIAPGYRSEVGYYRSFATGAQIRVPRCWSAAITTDGHSFTLVLEDAHPSRPGSQVDGATLTQAHAAIRNLAGLHAPFWGQDGLRDTASWLRHSDEAALSFFGELFATATGPFIDRFGPDLSPSDLDTLHRTADLFGRWGRHIGGRHSLIHGDYRLDNLLFSKATDGVPPEVMAVDWQSLEVGFPGRDVAYFLSTALAPELRRSHEKALVRAYHDRLLEIGVPDYPFEACFHDYRLGILQAPLITVLGAVYATNTPTENSHRMFLSMITNACAAIRELGTLDLLAA